MLVFVVFLFACVMFNAFVRLVVDVACAVVWRVFVFVPFFV